jgi:V/A-type H+-transporting ATPase subunit I
MILPMKKVCLVIQDKNQDEALAMLRKIGILHLVKTGAASDRLSKVVERRAKAESASGLIEQYKVPKKKPVKSKPYDGSWERRANPNDKHRGRRATDKAGCEEAEPYSLDAYNAPSRPDLVDLMLDMGKERKALEDRLVFLARERDRVAPWGNFDPAAVRELASLGLPVFLYEFTTEAFAAVPQDVRYVKLSEAKDSVRLLVLDREIPGIVPFQLPEKSLDGIKSEMESAKLELEKIEAKIKSFADRRMVLAKELRKIRGDIEFETARAELEKAEDVPAELGFSCLQGYIPAEDMGRLKKAAAENNWAFMADNPGEDDDVPTKLKNNSFVRLLYPLTDFLEVVPGYREADISGWFLLFFCIFFGMIFGDAGYGLLLFLISVFGILSTRKKGTPAIFRMMLLLSVFNTAWGVLTCSWFGVDPSVVPQFLKNISLSYISPAKSDQVYVDQNLQLFCFSLALLQLTIAHIKGILRNIKSLRVFAEIGSIGMLAGMYNLVLVLVVSNETRIFPMLPVSIYMLAGGFFLTFVFGNYEGSIGRSVLTSVKNIIPVVLGIPNVFSDIMSYIRLWAVGIAGASIAATVNTMAGPLLGSFLMFLGVLLLVFGHGLNLILNVLSVLVHGVRLNTLEFSGHVGLSWSGTAYRPFAVKK